MTELLTAAQMRAVEAAAIDAGDVTGLDLMERAGRGVVGAVFNEWPELAQAPHRAVVLCGPGNNGGDGFVVARLLKEWGWQVEVFLYGDPDKLPPDARVNYERWCTMGKVAPLNDGDFDDWPGAGSGHALIVDAIFGTGLRRPYLAHRHLAMTVNTCQSLSGSDGRFPRVVAVDVPSGLCSDSGRWLGDGQPLDFAPLANLTVSFHRPKTGHYLSDGPMSCGKIVKADIGLGDGARAGHEVVTQPDVARNATALMKRSGHKYHHGHALILSGGKGGAARLAARGALRIGAGLVTIGCPPAALAENAAQLNAVMLTRVEDAKALTEVLEDERINALCLGPGLGVGRDTVALVRAALASQRAIVLDADALSSFENDPEVLFAMLYKDCVLTPHAGEFARLFPDLAEKLTAPPNAGPAYSKVDATRAAAQRAGCVVLFKGPDTVIAGPDGRCAINSAHYDRAAPWLATAGSGDVLAGFLTGLLARGFSARMAAEAAAWLHVECARAFGPGLIAEDLPEMLPRVFRELGGQAGTVTSMPSA